MTESHKSLYLANPRGFCAGVDRAIEIVNRALELFGSPIYVRHEVVHNRFVVEDLQKRGACFVDELDEVPDTATVIFSAHGVPESVVDEAQRRGLRIFDATCPLVTKVHLEVARHAQQNEEVILIGHAGHPEVEGTMGRYLGAEGAGIYLVEKASDIDGLEISNSDALFYVTQTTLSVDDSAQIIAALRERFPNVQGPRKDDICYATQSRQDAVKQLASVSDLVLVVGSPNSSNSNRLREVADRAGCRAYLIDNAAEIDMAVIRQSRDVGVTAGASAPDVLIQEVINTLQLQGFELQGSAEAMDEEVVFSLPKELR